MRLIALICLGLVLMAGPAAADFASGFRTGGFAKPYSPGPGPSYGGGHKRSYGYRPQPRATIGGPSAAEIRGRAQGRYGPAQVPRRQYYRLDDWDRREHRRRKYHRNDRPIYYGDTIRRDETIVVVPRPVPAPPPPEIDVVVPVPVPVPVPDVRGPRFAPARGVLPSVPPFAVGQPLPPREPFVTLDWWRFDLPEPPPGQQYVRMGRDVLLIDSTSRMVIELVEPG